MSIGVGRYAGLITGKTAKVVDDAKPSAPVPRHVWTFRLLYPPSVNAIWRAVGGRVILSAVGRKYRGDVMAAVFDDVSRQPPLLGRLAATLVVFPPDKRRRDIDNPCKAVLDALEHCGVYDNDSQIDELHVYRAPVDPPKGHVDVTIMLADPVRARHEAGEDLSKIRRSLEDADVAEQTQTERK